MSTASIKIATSLCVALGILILLGWFVVGRPPQKGSARAVYRAYVRKGLVAATGLTVVVAGAGVGAFVLMRRARDEYRAEAMENLKKLLESSRQENEATQGSSENG